MPPLCVPPSCGGIYKHTEIIANKRRLCKPAEAAEHSASVCGTGDKCAKRRAGNKKAARKTRRRLIKYRLLKVSVKQPDEGLAMPGFVMNVTEKPSNINTFFKNPTWLDTIFVL